MRSHTHTQAETLGDWLWLSARANQRALGIGDTFAYAYVL